MKRVIYIIYLIFVSCNVGDKEKSLILKESMIINNKEWMTSNLVIQDSLNNNKKYFNYTEALNSCPNGWHLPSIKEWNQLLKNLNHSSSTLNQIFQSYNGIQIDDSLHLFKGKVGYFWASSTRPHIYYYKGVEDTMLHFSSSFNENYAISVRCIKD